jgi:ABC-type multidrug transport system fused ATPase/permease subunit
MSNLVPDSQDPRNLAPADSSRVLPDFIAKQTENLFNTTDYGEQKQILEIKGTAIELRKKFNEMETEEQLKNIEVEKRMQLAQLEIAEAKYKTTFFKVRQALGLASIPIFIGLGMYSYLENTSLGTLLIVLGLSGALLNPLQDVVKMLGLPTGKDNTKS